MNYSMQSICLCYATLHSNDLFCGKNECNHGMKPDVKLRSNEGTTKYKTNVDTTSSPAKRKQDLPIQICGIKRIMFMSSNLI